MEDVTSITFLIHKKTPRDTQLVGFHLSLPMGYIYSALYFCMATETVADLRKDAISQREQEGEHQLELVAKARATNNSGAHETQAGASWGHLPVEQRTAAKSNFDVYLDDLISVVQGGPRERQQMLRHFSPQIDRVLRPNEKADANCKYPISQKESGGRRWVMVHPEDSYRVVPVHNFPPASPPPQTTRESIGRTSCHP